MSVTTTYNALQIVSAAIRKLGINNPRPVQLEEGLIALNQLISQWMADKDLWIQNLVPAHGFTDLSDAVDLPGEYANMFIYNLAIALAPEYSTSVDQATALMAKTSIDAIKRQNYLALSTRIPANCVTR